MSGGKGFRLADCVSGCVFAILVLRASATLGGAMTLPPGFVRLADIAPSIRQDVRYAGHDNFMGRPAPGYEAADCWLRREAAEALARVQADAGKQGLGLIVWDCYRPQRATDAFVRWASDAADQAMKPRFYPAIDKAKLFQEGYIGRRSGHSTGLAVDLGLVGADGALLDFGSGFDLFDPRSWTASHAVGAPARANRERLKHLMETRGFANYPREWWHYSLPAGDGQAPAYDVPITR
jgi:D-alanyl-D-alanine dipeptidase